MLFHVSLCHVIQPSISKFMIALNWQDAKRRVIWSYRGWLRSVCGLKVWWQRESLGVINI